MYRFVLCESQRRTIGLEVTDFVGTVVPPAKPVDSDFPIESQCFSV